MARDTVATAYAIERSCINKAEVCGPSSSILCIMYDALKPKTLVHLHTHTHTHTRTRAHTHTLLFDLVCLCMCVCVSIQAPVCHLFFVVKLTNTLAKDRHKHA